MQVECYKMNKLSESLKRALLKKLRSPWSPLFKGFRLLFANLSRDGTQQSSEAMFTAVARDIVQTLRELDPSEEKLKLQVSVEQQSITVLFEPEMSFMEALIALLRLDRFWEIRVIEVL